MESTKITDSKLTQAVILCGGLGSRMRPFTLKMPKPMIPCNGRPFLWHLLKNLNEKGIIRFILLTGYLSDQIKNYFKDGKEWGWQIKYSNGPIDWDTGRRIWEAKDHFDLKFILLYSDNFIPFPYSKIVKFHEKHRLTLTLTACPKTPGNISVDNEGIVEFFDKNRNKKLHHVEIGYMVIEKLKLLESFEKPDCNFDDVLHRIASKKQVSAWINYDAYHSISDPERWKKTEEYLRPKKLILLDRDGVINKKAKTGEYITSWEKFEWINNTKKVLKKLSLEGFKYIVISNQAGISRGMVDQKQLIDIHKKMTTELSKDGIEILDIYYCPHHWDENCNCRKPKPGMLYKASKEHLFRLDKTLFIGDDKRDCQTAYNAGCGAIFLGDPKELISLPFNHQPDLIVTELENSLGFIREFYKQN